MPMFKVTCKWNGEPWEKDIEAEDEGDCAEHMYLFGVLISRPDKLIQEHHWIVDVKSSADIQRFDRSMYEYRYHVQDSFYSDGYKSLTGESPVFVFLVVSTTIDCGRYPVRVFNLDQQAKDIGRTTYKQNLRTYAECLKTDEWAGIRTLSLPYWAKELRNE